MNQHPRFAEIRAAAIAAFGEPSSVADTTSGDGRIKWDRIEWDRNGVVLIGTPRTVYFVDTLTSGAWWVVDDVTIGATVPLADAINALRPIVRGG